MTGPPLSERVEAIIGDVRAMGHDPRLSCDEGEPFWEAADLLESLLPTIERLQP